MVGDEDKGQLAGLVTRRNYLRSASWTDRSPTKPNPKPQPNRAARSCLPPLQPLSVTRRNLEEWPRAGSDDLGVWPHPQTPRGSLTPVANSSSEQQPPTREFQFKREKLAFFDKECSRIADHIYLGSDAVAKNRGVLRENGITHVLNCVGFVCPEYFKNDLVYKTLWLQDTPEEDITSILYDVFDYFEEVREQGGRVLVHCFQGVSRSASLVIAYLMWREGQSFEDAFQYVKAARGVTNPNMGFACQLLQCQKRVHAVPASPNSVLRMYRMAPHSPYDPLHLVPKMVNNPGAHGLDSRGAFIVHVPFAIYVWTGKNCSAVMANNAGAAASQVIRYERAQGPFTSIKEGEEPSEFWDALTCGQVVADDFGKDKVSAAVYGSLGERKVDEYDTDYEIFHKALAGGVVPPFSVSNTGSETCLPARENGWGRLRRKFANGIMKGFVMSSKQSCSVAPITDGSEMIIDATQEEEQTVSQAGTSSPASPCGSPDSFSCFPNSSPDRIKDICKENASSSTPCSPDSGFTGGSPKFSSKSPTLSPSNSDHSSSFTFSPSSSNWSDLSFFSSQQPSPSGLESTDLFTIKKPSLVENPCLSPNLLSPSPTEAFSANGALRVSNTCFTKGKFPSIAERRGSSPPPRMFLSAIDEPTEAPKNLVRSWSFSLPNFDDEVMEDPDFSHFEGEGNGEELMLDADLISADRDSPSKVEDRKEYSSADLPSGHVIDDVAEMTNPVLYKWPRMNKVEMAQLRILSSGSAYVLLAPDASLGNPVAVYVWLGRDVSYSQGQRQLLSCDGTNDDHFHWQMVGHNILSQTGLPENAPIQVEDSEITNGHFVQIVKEGEEPEQFLNHLNYFLSREVEDRCN